MTTIVASGVVVASKSFWGSKLGAWIEVITLAIVVYIVTFAGLVLLKPALILKSSSVQSRGKEQSRNENRRAVTIQLKERTPNSAPAFPLSSLSSSPKIEEWVVIKHQEKSDEKQTQSGEEEKTKEPSRQQEEKEKEKEKEKDKKREREREGEHRREHDPNNNNSGFEGFPHSSLLNPLSQMTDLICSTSPLASFAFKKIQDQTTQENLKSFLQNLAQTKQEQCWEVQEVDWRLTSIVSVVPSCLFLLLVVAAL